MESERIVGITREIALIDAALSSEIVHPRVPPQCNACANLRRQIDSDLARRRDTQRQFVELKQELDDAGILIDALKEEARKTSYENESLKENLKNLEKELSLLRKQTSSSSVPHSELAKERKLRKKAESEVELYRRQSKPIDGNALNNSRRVAIALASHCFQMSQELSLLKGARDPSKLEWAELFPEPNPREDTPTSIPAVAIGWDTGEDDLFESLQ
jgi:septal ring factor EnvC (AmiA/AmiB activator)